MSNLETLIPLAGVTLTDLALEAEELRDACDRMIESVGRYVGRGCTDPARCRAATRDAGPTIAIMEEMFGRGVPAFEAV